MVSQREKKNTRTRCHGDSYPDVDKSDNMMSDQFFRPPTSAKTAAKKCVEIADAGSVRRRYDVTICGAPNAIYPPELVLPLVFELGFPRSRTSKTTWFLVLSTISIEKRSTILVRRNTKIPTEFFSSVSRINSCLCRQRIWESFKR